MLIRCRSPNLAASEQKILGWFTAAKLNRIHINSDRSQGQKQRSTNKSMQLQVSSLSSHRANLRGDGGPVPDDHIYEGQRGYVERYAKKS